MMAPGYGPPFIIEPSGEKRNALLNDVHKLCKLVQTSKYLDFNSSIVVQPTEVPLVTDHLDIEEKRRTKQSILPILKSCNLTVADTTEYSEWIQSRKVYKN